MILPGNRPSKISKNSVFCKFHMENERFCSDVVNAIIAAIQRPNKSFKISQKIAKSSKFDHCVPKPSNFFHFSNFFIQILIPKTLYIYIHFFFIFNFSRYLVYTPRKIRIFPSISNSNYHILRVYYVETTILLPFILPDTIRSDLTNHFYD